MRDATAEIQARFDSGNYDLTGFDGCGVTTLNLKHANIRIDATEPTSIIMLPLMHPTKPGYSKSVPLINCDQRTGLGNFESIYVGSNITFDGAFINQVQDAATNLKVSDPMGLARNIFDQVLDDAIDTIEKFEWHAEAINCAGTVVSLSNVIRAKVRGSYFNIANKCLGVAYNQENMPMIIDFEPAFIYGVNSVLDFSAPPLNKTFKRNPAPLGIVRNVYARNVYGRTKCHGHWALDFSNVHISAPPQPTPCQYSGFTVANDTIEYARFKDCHFDGFLRAGLELRNSIGPVHIDGVHVKNSLYNLMYNGTRPVSYGARNTVYNCKHAVDNVGDNPQISDWDQVVAAAKEEALRLGITINFPN